MSGRFKNQASATKWLASVSGCFLEENSAEGKWAAYVSHKSGKDGMAVCYGDTPIEAISAAADLLEG